MYEIDKDTPEIELRRADHLIYVSLKYTRTCDIIKNAIKRLLNTFDLSFKEYLKYLKEKGTIKEIPATRKEKADLFKEYVPIKGKKHLILYNKLDKVNKANFTRKEDFRKNVTLTTTDKRPIAVKVVNLYEFLEETKEFVRFIKKETQK